MDVNDLKGLYAEVNKRMTTAIDHLKHELAGVRTGRATTGILDPVHVEAYGSRMPLNQLASLSIPEPTMIVAQPFDPSQLGAIEKAIRASDLGLNPSNDGKVVRIPIPPLTEERRKDLVKQIHRLAEDHKVGVREARRDALAMLKDLETEGSVPADDRKREEKRIQTLTDEHIKKIDEMQAAKEAELLQV
jgi:ribosome recycling factor